MNELDVIINETNQESMKIKRTLDANRPRHGGAAGSAKAQIESNMYATYTRKFHDVMVRYNRVANEFKQQNRNRDARMLRTIDPSIDDQRAEEIVDSGQVSQILSQALVSDDLQDAVRGIEERHVEILKLEQQVIGINELFKDLATLVDLQQESLDVIENRIIHAENYAKKGEEELDSAAIYAAKARRRMCIFCFCILILGLILLAVLTPIFTTVIHSATNN
jgi:syntaxin 1B/2/3